MASCCQETPAGFIIEIVADLARIEGVPMRVGMELAGVLTWFKKAAESCLVGATGCLRKVLQHWLRQVAHRRPCR